MSSAAYPPYESYKATSVRWVDKTPINWDIVRIQDFSTINDDIVDEREYRNRRIRYVDISGINATSNTYTFEEQEFQQAPSRARRLVKSGDTVFSTVRPYLKAVATIDAPEDDLVFSTGFAVIRPRENANSHFIGYLVRDDRFIDEVTARSVGTSYPAINASELAKLHVLLPPLPEQRTIAAFLDEKCAKIDDAVWIKEKQVQLLLERKQILIQQAVTRGLNPDAPMKDSGIEWVGQIPSHWEVRKVSRAFRRIGSGTTPDTGRCGFYEGDTRWLQTGDLTDGTVSTTGKSISTLALREYSTLKVYPPGSLVMAMYGATIGKLGKLTIAAATNQACCVFSESGIVTSDFAFYSFLAMRPQILSAAYGGGQPNISQQTIKAFQIILPPISEQKVISEHLDKQSEALEKAISIKQDQITALKEYKTTLINAAVTGKIKVI